MKKIGFIGVGIMGSGMVRNLLKAGYDVNIYARHPEKVQAVIVDGAVLFPDIRRCVEASELVITMVGFPSDVEEVYFGKGGILDSSRPGMTLIDMTTTSPELSKRIWEAGRERDVRVLDAPVTGGDSGARNGTLSILVGGDKDCFDACYALFSAMGKTISYMGPAGSGQHAKLANQIMISGTICGVCEALTYAENEGLDLSALIQAVKGGAAGSSQLNALGEKMTVGDYAPGFFIKHFIKDMRLASEEAEKAGLNLDILRLVLAKYQSLAEEYGDSGTQALIEFYKKQQS